MPRNLGPGGSPAHQPGSDSRQSSAGVTGTLSFRGGHGHVNVATRCHVVLRPWRSESSGEALHDSVRSFLTRYLRISSRGITLVQTDLRALEEADRQSLDKTSLRGFLP